MIVARDSAVLETDGRGTGNAVSDKMKIGFLTDERHANGEVAETKHLDCASALLSLQLRESSTERDSAEATTPTSSNSSFTRRYPGFFCPAP